jgi:hypothetical protein
MGSGVMMPFRHSRAFVHLLVHKKVVPFFKRFVKGFVMLVNPGMKGRWNLRTPRVLLTSLMFFRILGHSLIPAILLGSMVISPCSSHTPKKLTSGCLKTHFDGFRKNECCSKRSSSRWFIC